MNLKAKLLTSFLLVGIIPFAAVSITSVIKSGSSLKDEAMAELTAMRDIKSQQLKTYFQERKGDMQVLNETVDMLRKQAFDKLAAIGNNRKMQIESYIGKALSDMEMLAGGKDVFTIYKKLVEYHVKTKVKADGAYGIDTEEYKKLYADYGKSLNKYMTKSDFEDMYLVCTAHGHVMYTSEKSTDMGSNLRYGPYKDSGLHRLLEKVISTKGPSVIDFSFYGPNKEVVAFAGAPVRNETGNMIGMMAVKIGLSQINKVMKNNFGMGETGETYLVGPDYLMRSDSRLSPDTHNVRASILNPQKGSVKTRASEEATSGKSGSDVIIDYLGNPVLSFWETVKFGDVNWALIAEVDVAEAFSPCEGDRSKKENYFFYKYTHAYGYYDLFLINPDGFIYYTAEREDDYQKNALTSSLLEGSGLQKLVKKVKATKEFGFQDFSPYKPSGNIPAAFIAQPVMHGEELEMIVALQLSNKAISNMISSGSNKESEQECYAVGPDGYMRSDSLLNEKYSVTETFKEKTQVKSTAITEALNGNPNTEITTNYAGEEVITSYSGIKVYDKQWALVADIGTHHALAAVREIELFVAIFALVGIAAILLVGILIAKAIVTPIKNTSDMLQTIAEGEGDLTHRLEVLTKDEVGDLSKWFNTFMQKLQEMIKHIKESTTTIASASEELSAVSNQLATGSEEMSSQASNVAGATEQVSSNINMMASASEEMSVNAGSVSAAAEQMSTNMNSIAEAMERVQQAITEIEASAQEGDTISKQGMEKATSATETMKRLDKAAEEIGQVTEVIKRIAEQTNLLALNATIEAASAGEAGKGFAVVANEIKELANQSATAAEDITRRIEGVQSNTREAVDVIGEVSDVIGHISQSSSMISSSVQEQASMASSISMNVSEAKNGADNIANAISEVAKGAEDVSRNAGEAAKGANEVAANINGVNDAANDSRAGSHQVNSSANDMAQLAGELKSMVGGFKVE